MKTTDLVDDIVERLHGEACSGDVAEVLVLYRDRAGDWHAGMAARDATELLDAARLALDELEREGGRSATRRLNS